MPIKKNYDEFIGQKRGMLTALEIIFKPKAYIKCHCECGKETILRFNAWNKEITKSCGCLQQISFILNSKIYNDSQKLKLEGKKYGKLLVLNEVKNYKYRASYFLCRCDCGREKIIKGCNLINGGSTTCGRCKQVYSDPEKCRLASAKQVMRNYQDGDLTFEDFLYLTSQNCYYCGVTPYKVKNRFKAKSIRSSDFAKTHGDFIYNGLDRIDSNKLHDKNNVVPCCSICNAMKSKLTINQFVDWLKRIKYKFITNYTIDNNYLCKLTAPNLYSKLELKITEIKRGKKYKSGKIYTNSADVKLSAYNAVYHDRYDDGNLDYWDVLVLFRQPCAYCDRYPDQSNCRIFSGKYAHQVHTQFYKDNYKVYYNGIDRVDNTQSHNINNSISCCKTCNTAKSDHTVEFFHQHLTKLHNNFIASEKYLELWSDPKKIMNVSESNFSGNLRTILDNTI